MRIRILASKNLEKVLKQASNPYLLACHLQIDADPDPAYHVDADPDPTFQLDADPQHCPLTCVGKYFNFYNTQVRKTILWPIHE
jgi:hypothetical protein